MVFSLNSSFSKTMKLLNKTTQSKPSMVNGFPLNYSVYRFFGKSPFQTAAPTAFKVVVVLFSFFFFWCQKPKEKRILCLRLSYKEKGGQRGYNVSNLDKIGLGQAMYSLVHLMVPKVLFFVKISWNRNRNGIFSVFLGIEKFFFFFW